MKREQGRAGSGHNTCCDAAREEMKKVKSIRGNCRCGREHVGMSNLILRDQNKVGHIRPYGHTIGSLSTTEMSCRCAYDGEIILRPGHALSEYSGTRLAWVFRGKIGIVTINVKLGARR